MEKFSINITFPSTLLMCFGSTGIDVKHPKDYSKSIPNQKSEGLLIEGNQYYRILHNGEKKKI